jgi:hypothetical protein
MADGKVPQSSGTGLEAVIQLADLLGGKRQTTTQTMNPGDVAALQKVVADAQSQDFTKLLESIFAQAQGAIPQVGANYGRRMGRSYGNVGAQSALNEILKQATLEGQKQIAEQQIRNRELQANAGAAIAQATKGTTQTTSQRTKNPLGAPIGLLLAANALNDVSKGAVFEMPKKILGGIGAGLGSGGGSGGSVSSAPAYSAPTAAPQVTAMSAPAAARPLTSAPAQGFSLFPEVSLSAPNWAAGDSGLGQFVQNPISTITDIATAPIQWGMQGIDYASEQVNNIWKLLSGGR